MRSPLRTARWAPFRSRLSNVVAASLLASLFAVSAVAASPAPVAAGTSASWYAVETYYLRLVNCTRTGGWVRTDGSCDGYGSGRYSAYVAPVKRSAGVSNVARGWARSLAVNNRCTHGDPAARLRRSGYRSWRWGENLGCGSGYATMRKAVLASHLLMQGEKACNGRHWKNIKNASFKYVGVGVWRTGSRVRIVTDYYTP